MTNQQDMTPTLKMGETIKIEGKNVTMKFKIVESGQLDNRTLEPLPKLKKVE